MYNNIQLELQDNWSNDADTLLIEKHVSYYIQSILKNDK